MSISEKMKALWADPEFRERTLQARRATLQAGGKLGPSIDEAQEDAIFDGGVKQDDGTSAVCATFRDDPRADSYDWGMRMAPW